MRPGKAGIRSGCRGSGELRQQGVTAAGSDPRHDPETLPARLARLALLLFVFLLPFMQPAPLLLGYELVAADAAWLVLAPLWGLALVTGAARLRWHPGFWLLGLYLAAMILATLASEQPLRSAVKLASQFYLLSLPVIVLSLVRGESGLRRLMQAWLAATALVALAAIASVAAFYLDPGNPLLRYTINDYGTLPPGPYPRLRLTFLYAAMTCNYLTVSLMILLAARRLDWIGRTPFALLLAGLLFAAAFSLTPGLGGLFLAGGFWAWLLLEPRRRALARLSLTAGIAAAALFVVTMALTPFLHSTAPFLVTAPGTDLTLAPAVRLMAWLDAARNFAADPWLGRGLGLEAADVTILLPSGQLSGVTDAHNTFLNVAVQCGMIGLAALVALLVWVWRRTGPFRLGEDRPGDVLRLALGFAFLNAFAYQGLGGSFEDARHLWLLLGLFLAATCVAANEKGRLPEEPPLARIEPGWRRGRPEAPLAKLDGAAGFLDLLLDLLGLGLGDAFLDRLGRALDQRLGLAEAELGDRAHFLDHVDLLAAVAGEDDVELGLLLLGRSGGGAAAGGGGCHRGRGGNAPFLLERLGQVGGLEHGQLGKLINKRIDVCHFRNSVRSVRLGW